MKRISILVCAAAVILAGCATTPAAKSAENLDLIGDDFVLTKEIADSFSIGAQFSMKPGNDVWNNFLGTVTRCSSDPGNPTNLGIFVEVEAPFEYFWKGERRLVNFYFIYANLGEISDRLHPGYKIYSGDLKKPIGKTGTGSSPVLNTADLLFAFYTDKPNILAEYMTSGSGIEKLGVYWYSPLPFVDGTLPGVNVLGYRDITYEKFDFMGAPANDTMFRFFYTLNEYPKQIQIADYSDIYMSAVLAGKLPNYNTMNYTFACVENVGDTEIVILFPEELVKLYKKRRFYKGEIYLITHVAAKDDTTVLLVVDNSMDTAPEFLWRDPDTRNIQVR